MKITTFYRLFPLLLAQLFLLGQPNGIASISEHTSDSTPLSTDTLPHFREVWVNTVSDVQFYDVFLTGVTTMLTLESENPLKISLDCYEGFDTLIVLTPDAGIIHQRIFVRAFTDVTGDFSPVIKHRTPAGLNLELPAGVRVVAGGAPSGYYTTATAAGSELKTQLHHIIRNHTVLAYNSLWSHFESTDATFDGYVWDIYSDVPCEEPPYIFSFGIDQDTGTGGNNEGDVFNREHSMPRSWFGGSVFPMNSDMYHIYPVDKHVNAVRENFPFGMVEQPTWISQNGSRLGPNSAGLTYSGTAFEPIDAYKGDLARAFLYMITRYEDEISSWTFSEEGNTMLDHNPWPGFEPWAIEMLMQWHRDDPVSQRERLRNDIIFQFQGNRNPFVDHPEFAEKIWGDPNTFIQDSQYANNVIVFPVPAKDKIQFKASQIIQKAEIYSLKGETVKVILPYKQESSANLSNIQPGMYLIRFYFENGFTVRSLIIQ